MIVIADSKKRVTLPTRPGVSFELEAFGDERFILTRHVPVTPKPAKVTFTKINGRTVGQTSHKVSAKAIEEALAEFP